MSETAKQPPIDLSFERVLCPRHGEPFRALWPKGYALMACAGFQKLPEEFWKECRDLMPPDAGPDAKIDRAYIEAVLDLKPICCRIGEERLFEIYRDAEIGRKALCQVCMKTRLGGPMQTTTKRYQHVCFECTLYRMWPA